MVLYAIIFGAFLGFVIQRSAKKDMPGCHFLETVNLTSSQSFKNGSYMYEGIEVPVELTGQYDYITTENNHNETTESHVRGCVCRLKPCIWICCRFKDWDASNGKCADGLMEKLSKINPFLNVTLRSGSVVKRNLLKDFIVLRDRMRRFDVWKEDKYTLLENGSLLLNSFNTINVRGYDCLHPNQFTSDSTMTVVAAIHKHSYCRKQRQESLIIKTLYPFIRKLRNLHGKCFLCYMIIYLFYEVEKDFIGLQFCTLQGYFGHFFFIAKFSWLLALSHQLWRGLSAVNRHESEYSFAAYSTLAWGTPAVLTGIPFLIEQIWDSDPNKVKWVPGMGYYHCNTDNLYLAFPFLTLLASSTILYILTLICIIRVKLLLRHFSDQHEKKQNLSSRMQKYYLFLRLSIVMDIKWSIHV